MTKEEALRILDTIPTKGEVVDALEMAIEALENTPTVDTTTKRTDKRTETHGVCSDDMIKRTDAIDALLQRLDALKGLSFGTSTFRDGIADGYARIMSDLKALPSAQPDVRENVKGKWVYQSFGGYHCNQCGNQAPFWCMASTQNLTDFCPNCGAEMEGSEDE